MWNLKKQYKPTSKTKTQTHREQMDVGREECEMSEGA